MSEITLYLHIGSGKTGSTAVQRFLAQNFSRLLEIGVLYPNFDYTDISIPTQPDYWQGRYFEDFRRFHDLKRFNRCIEYCKENSLHSIVISDEAFLINWCDRISRLAGKLDARIKIICYFRRQDHYLEAAWKQWGYNFFSANELLDSIGKKEWGAWGIMDWHTAIEPWAKNFGKENIIIRPYEKQQLPDGILPDFLDAIGVVWPEKPKVAPGIDVNHGFSRDILEFLYLNRGLYGDPIDSKIYKMLHAVLDDKFRKNMFDTYKILSPKDRIELLKKYEPSNQMLAREYLNREDGCLFYEPWPSLDDHWEPYAGLSIERLTPILTKTIYNLYEKHNELNTQYNDLKQQQEVLNNQYQDLKQQQEVLNNQYQDLNQQQALNTAFQESHTTSSLQKPESLFDRLTRILEGITKKFALRRIDKQKADLALIRSSGLFDEEWYLANNLDVAQAKVDPLFHYLNYGGAKGRDPGPNFASRWYLDTYKDVKEAGDNPLLHYLKYGQHKGYKPQPDPIFVDQKAEIESSTIDVLDLIRTSDLFDESWYLANYPDVARAKLDPAFHYLEHGGFEGRDPGPKFSSSWYLDTYKDVKEAGDNPLLHYLKYGQHKGYKPRQDPIFVDQTAEIGSSTVDVLHLVRTSDLFDESWYLENYPDVAREKLDPALHYLEHGGFEGRDPGPNFSSNWYLLKYKDVKETGMNPLAHYLQYGKDEGRKLKPDPIIFYRMGAVSFKTLPLSLLETYEDLGITVFIYHIHWLNNFDAIRQNAILDQRQQNTADTLAALKYAETVRRQMDENPAQRWQIVSLVRDPIARNIAAFFHNLSEYIPDWRERYADGRLNLHELQTLFLSLSPVYMKKMNDWFDEQMKLVPAIGIDVYETPFPYETGYKIFPGALQASLLLIRQENLNDCAMRAMLEFLDLENFTLQNTKSDDEKEYADLYRAFKGIPLPAAYVNEMYKTRLARHFYSDEELERFTQRWTKNAETE